MSRRRSKRAQVSVVPEQAGGLPDRAAARTVNTLISALSAGAAIGSMIVPGLGTIIGSIVAGCIAGMTQETVSKALLEHIARARHHIDDRKASRRPNEGDTK